jgi:hypothetical protein
MLSAAVAELGMADGSYLFTKARARLDGTPWVTGFDYRQMPELGRLLQTACYMVIGYLSGMRDSEKCLSWYLATNFSVGTTADNLSHCVRPTGPEGFA